MSVSLPEKTLYRVLILYLSLKGCLGFVDVIPKEAIALPNENATFLCTLRVPLQYCRVLIPGIGSLNLNSKLQSRKGVSYYGNGLDSGQCGFIINRVTEENNGKITCFLGIETEDQEKEGGMHLTVARAPKAPELEVARNADPHRINDVLQASCVVRDGRPVANISWYLDDEPLLDGLSMPSVFDYVKEDLHTKVQNISRQLHASDHGKHLKCVATHPAMQQNTASTMKLLNVQYPPLPQGNPIERFGFELSQPGTIQVEIEANPQPMVEWTVREQKIQAGSVDATGRIHAEEVQDMGRGKYLANLRIAAITKQDTETQYILTAMNSIGAQDYSILISTSPEPEGFDLGVGGIVGIVVVLMLVMVLVFTVIIARIKGKWCFSASSSNRNVENSDTESVQHTDSKRSLVPKLSDFFAKKKEAASPSHQSDDLNAPTEEGESDKKNSAPTDETLTTTDKNDSNKDVKEHNREGVVYAELDLVNVNPKPVVLKTDDEKTEYAEIVYTNEEGKEKNV
nr:fasciclin-3 isoform X1 [Onthophagus taurus]